MVNVPKPRKVDDSKNLLKKANKASKKIELHTNLEDILNAFNELLFAQNNNNLTDAQNQIVSIAVRQFLSSLQSQLNRNKKETEININENNNDYFEKITESVINSFNALNLLLSNNSSFPETVTLSSLCASFLLINYFQNFSFKFNLNGTLNEKLVSIWASIEVYFNLFNHSFKLNKECLMQAFEIDQNYLVIIHEKINTILLDKSNNSHFNFRDAAILSGLLNCMSIVRVFTSDMIDSFGNIFQMIIKLSCAKLHHEFHVIRLLNHYLKLLVDNRKLIEAFYTTNENKSYCNFLVDICSKTMPIIDNNWESPITGVINSVKQTYQLIIELAKHSALMFLEVRSILIEQLRHSLSLPFTCKAKYKKLSILIQTLTNEHMNIEEIGQFENSKLSNQPILLCQVPFYLDKRFYFQVVHHLSINSLATSIAEFYKSTVCSIVDACNDCSPSLVTQIWTKLWLNPIMGVLNADYALSSSTVIHNTLLAHILPTTIKMIPNSMQMLMDGLSKCPCGQVSVVRIYLEIKSKLTPTNDALPPPSWLGSILVDSDDMTRAEGLALLIDEKFLSKQRTLVCQLVLDFIKTNLNVDNAAFRQKIISKLDQFYRKVINSICDRHHSNSILAELNPNDRRVVEFLYDTINVLALSLCPGSSFQRKFTSLSIFGSLLEIIAKEDSKLTLPNLFSQLWAENDEQQTRGMSIKKLLLFGLIDKDDKIRRLTCEILIQYSRSSLVELPYERNNFNLDDVYDTADTFLHSFRHQECHVGGLLCKYFVRIDVRKLSMFRNNDNPALSLIQNLIDVSHQKFYSDNFRLNLLKSAKCDPLHGRILALNQCLTFDSFFEGVLNPSNSVNSADLCYHYHNILFQKDLRDLVFKKCINLSLDCLDYFLKLLMPKNADHKANLLDVENDDTDGYEDNFASPSFYEMCQSIQSILENNDNHSNDVFLSNNFQLILSMCWLNIKEHCFMLTTLTFLFADLLCFINDHNDLAKHFKNFDQNYFLISPDELFQMGMKIVMLMSKCRHKGVIEASGVSLSKFTRTLLRIQCYLITSKHISPAMCRAYRTALERFITEILTIVDFRRQTTGTSVTRRSAGLALIVQSVLVGESEAIYLDGIRPIEDGLSGNTTLYDQIVSLLITIATTGIECLNEQPNEDELQLVDLPQANALHVLRSIIGTSALSNLSYKTVEQLFPICIEGFTSSLWQIRNASLQLFGACITRMLGQKKRPKSTKGDCELEYGATITFDEFISRYPTILKVIHQQFSSCSSESSLHPELVPLLSLLASFTPAGQTDQIGTIKLQLVESLNGFLSNRIWKIRMLAAKSLANLLSIHEFETLILNSLQLQPSIISCNRIHGLLCCLEVLFELKANPFEHQDNLHKLKCQFKNEFKAHLEHKSCDILNELANVVLGEDKKVYLFDRSIDISPNNESMNNTNLTGNDIENVLKTVQKNVSFKMSDDIRLSSALMLESYCSNNTISFNTNRLLEIFVDVMITIFEDEERQVRVVAQRIATSLYKTIKPSTQFSVECFAQNTSIKCFFEWLEVQISSFQCPLFLLISMFSRLSSFDHNIFQLTNSSSVEVDEFILFEKEEKNVFAEPFLMNVRIGNFIKTKLSNSSEELVRLFVGSDWNKLETDLKLISSEFMAQLSIQNLSAQHWMGQSIWKLPKTICFLTNLYLTVEILVKYFPTGHFLSKYSGLSKELLKHFQFLQHLSESNEMPLSNSNIL